MTTQGGKYQLLPDMSPEEYADLKEDIRQHGVKLGIEFDLEDNILDGHHRFRAFCELIDAGEDIPMFDKITRPFKTEDEKLAHVLSINLNRRNLNREQRQELVVRLRRDFGMTIQKIADAVGASTATVWRTIDDAPEEVRDELRALVIKTGDGRQMTASFTPRTFITGNTQIAQAAAITKGEEQQAAAAAGAPPPTAAAVNYAVLISCKDEGEQSELLERLLEEGYDVKALML